MASLQPLLMSDKRYDEISARVRKSYPNACILYIDEIINPALKEAYEFQKAELQRIRGPDKIKELSLFHGTSEKCALSIATSGYDVSKNRVAAFGLGTYFAPDAATSLGYVKDNEKKESFMLSNLVLIGSIGMYGSNQEIITDVHDNSVNNMMHPTIFVTPYNHGALPQYLIAFHKYARA